MLTLLLALSPAFADDVRYTLVRRDAKLCEVAKDDAKCVTVGIAAEPGAVWRDPIPSVVVEDKGDWVLVDSGAVLPEGLCQPRGPTPPGVEVRAWVKRTDLVPATVAPMSFTGPGGTVAIAAGVPVGVPYRGQQGAWATPFLGSLIIAPEATSVMWTHAPPSVPAPANPQPLKSVASILLDLGAAGNGSLLPGAHSGVIDEASGKVTLASRCAVATVPIASAVASELKVVDAAPAPAAAPSVGSEGTGVITLPAGTALLWESGKPAGKTNASVTIPADKVATKGKNACAQMPLEGLKDRALTLCFAKDLAIPK